jgi:hypothetical protein
VSSANLTFPREPAQGSASGRRPDLVNGAFELLVALIAASEDLDSAEDSPDPELAVVESDDKAMADAAAEMYEARREQAAR